MARWGYTQLSVYITCPLLFYFERVQKIAIPRDDRNAYIGNVLGRMMEQFYLEHWWREPRVLPDRMAISAKEIGKKLHTEQKLPWRVGEREEREAVIAKTIPTILQVVREERLIAPSMGVEYEIVVPIEQGKDYIVGRIDLWLLEQARLTLLDLKGGGSLGKYVSADQLRLYALGTLSDARFKRLPDRMGFWWLRHGKIIWRQFNRKTLLTFYNGIRTTLENIRAKRFDPTPSSHCRICDFLSRCEAGQVHTRPANRGVPTDDNHGRLDLNAASSAEVE